MRRYSRDARLRAELRVADALAGKRSAMSSGKVLGTVGTFGSIGAFFALGAMTAMLGGCSSAAWRPDAATSATAPLVFGGSVHGGQQPIVGATMQLYAVGTSGFQSASRTLLTSSVTTQAGGTFTLTGTYTCGTATQVYLVATGGNAGSGTNANSALMTALGPCSSLSSSTFISVNELTTVAAVSALAPYMLSYATIGSSSGGTYTTTEALALAQAFTLARQFVDTGSGAAPGQNVPNGMTLPASLLNTLGDVLAACVNSAGGVAGDATACGKLFTLATPPGGTAPTNTIAAMLNIANHPTQNLTDLFNLAAPAGPFQPQLSTAPASFDVTLVPMTVSVTRTLHVEPDEGFGWAYALVNGAASTIDMTMYELVDTTMSADLVAACQRGLTVRVILDQNNEMSNNLPAYSQLNAQAHCSAAWANPAFQVTHQKTFIVDGTQVAILSANLTSRYYSGTRDFALVENDPVDIAAIQATFNADYNSTTDYNYVPSNGDDLIWSPTTARSGLVSLINNATTSLLVENEEMSDSTIVTALKNACTRGVAVNITMTDSSSYHSNFSALEAAGCGVHVYPNSTRYIYIHAKVIIADYGTAGQIGYMGSINFSTASMIENRELGVYVSDAGLLQTLRNTLTTDYAGAAAY